MLGFFDRDMGVVRRGLRPLAAALLLGAGAAAMPQWSVADVPGGAYGQQTGRAYEQRLPDGARLIEIRVYHDGDGIVGVQFHYQLANGFFNMLPILGARGGTETVFELAEGDQLRGLSGTLDGAGELKSLILISDRANSGTIGPAGERRFQIDLATEERLVGLTGWGANRVAAIGLMTDSAAGAGAEAEAGSAAPSGAEPRLTWWHVQTRDFKCLDSGDDIDNRVELFGDLTLAYEVREGRRMAFLFNRSEEYEFEIPCDGSAVNDPDRFTYVDFNISAPEGQSPWGVMWFINQLTEADIGSWPNEHDTLGPKTSQPTPLPIAEGSLVQNIAFAEPGARNPTRLQITLEVTPIFE